MALNLHPSPIRPIMPWSLTDYGDSCHASWPVIILASGERMAQQNVYDVLAQAAALEGDIGGIRITAVYDPIGGEGSRVFPPTYPSTDEKPYLIEKRRVDGKEREDALLSSSAGQANIAEQALLRAWGSGEISLPIMRLLHQGQAEMTLTSLEFPHRYADAYVRDSLLDGQPFDRSELGQALRAATPDDARALFRHDPGSLVFGAWDSHRKGRQQRFPRIYSSELIGWDPVVAKRSAGRLDPLNLKGAVKPEKDAQGWDFVASGQKVKGERLSEIGHGNIAPNPQHGGVTISSAQRMATISLAGLDRIGFGDAPREASVAARVALAAYALLADRLAFSAPSLWLRSGCELMLREERLEWVRRGNVTDRFELSRREAVELFQNAVQRSAAAGIGFATDVIDLRPSPALAKAIDFSLTSAAPEAGE
ncbi:type I-U CRISPR-associated protein Cas7 [Kineosporia sp. J2-2]|uniref:Type I-U CRISPR-associated protein Cas7 n=1 Tax=Kineosporia corallincola TaxID=2835133 RepID=A0ABS5TTP9_9ACTN|nr:type I-U CRISPR-associated RAMP protein Csb1/Cas7u [Kineosporia corallincola]MBT0774158.1 type I-U CRISPR-associated protein Cas7 [Kineosporia corallincola]